MDFSLSLKVFSFYISKLIYEAWALFNRNGPISLQPLGADHATLPHMKAIVEIM